MELVFTVSGWYNEGLQWNQCLLYQVGIMKACSGISVYCIRLV